MECALAAAVARVVHVSSAVVYGRPADSPFTEESPVGPDPLQRVRPDEVRGDDRSPGSCTSGAGCRS